MSMTTQEIFNHVVAHLRTQNCVSRNNITGECAYRGTLGLKCAAGSLIHDDDYNPDMEGNGSGHITVKLAIEKFVGRKLEAKDHLLIRQLQICHDSYAIESWENNFKEYAEENGLEVPPIPA